MTENNNNEEYQVCYKHPDRKTYLRCNQCGRPICLECAVQTPTGYRCKECVKEQQKKFNTSIGRDYLIGGAIAAAVGAAGSYFDGIIPFIPTYISAVIVGMLLGRLICMLVRAAVNKRRSDTLTIVVTIAAGVGALIPHFQILSFLVETGSILLALISLIYPAVLCFTIWSEMSGMVFRR